MAAVSCGFLPQLITDAALKGSFAVVFDVLRATTVMAHALANGCAGITPLLTVEEAFALRAAQPRVLLGGERKGVRIDGFDMGNSPCEYGRDKVGGRAVGITTTNGTVALHRCKGHASRIATGSFVNLTATSSLVARARPAKISLVCAGTDIAVAREDVLCAGALIERLIHRGAVGTLDDQALLALDAWRAVAASSEGLHAALAACRGGTNIAQLGLQDDIALAAKIDLFATATEVDLTSWSVRDADRHDHMTAIKTTQQSG